MGALECYFCAMRGNGIRHTLSCPTAYDAGCNSIQCFLPWHTMLLTISYNAFGSII